MLFICLFIFKIFFLTAIYIYNPFSLYLLHWKESEVQLSDDFTRRGLVVTRAGETRRLTQFHYQVPPALPALSLLLPFMPTLPLIISLSLLRLKHFFKKSIKQTLIMISFNKGFMSECVCSKYVTSQVLKKS